MVIKSIFIFLYTLLNSTLKRTTLFNRILIASNLASAVIYLKYPTEVSNLMISNNKTTSFHFFQLFSFPYISTPHIIFLFSNIYFIIGQSTLEKQLGTLSFLYYFTLNNILIGILLKGILMLFNESYLESGQCYDSPCVLYGPCAFNTFYYYKALMEYPNIEYNLIGNFKVRLKYLPWALLSAQFLFVFFIPPLLDYFLDSVVGIVLIYLRKKYLDKFGVMKWTVLRQDLVEKVELFIKGIVEWKSYVSLPSSRIKKSVYILNGMEDSVVKNKIRNDSTEKSDI